MPYAMAEAMVRRVVGIKLTDEVLPIAQACLDQGCSQSQAARALGVSETAVRHAIKTGRLRRQRPRQHRAALLPGERAERDAAQARGAGTAVKRLEERVLACQGMLGEAAPHFEPAEGVANAGVLLALPAMIGEGLLCHAERVYAPLKAGFYGLHSILWCLVMMALLRIKSIERLVSWASCWDWIACRKSKRCGVSSRNWEFANRRRN